MGGGGVFTCLTPGLYSYQASTSFSSPGGGLGVGQMQAEKGGVVLQNTTTGNAATAGTPTQLRVSVRGCVRLQNGNTFRITTAVSPASSTLSYSRLTVIRISA